MVDFGAFVEILPGTDGLLHVSEMAAHRVQDVRSEVKEGDQVLVKVVNIEPGTGKIRLSRKALLSEAELAAGAAQGGGEGQPVGAERGPGGGGRPYGGDRPHRGGDRDRGGRGRGPGGGGGYGRR